MGVARRQTRVAVGQLRSVRNRAPIPYASLRGFPR